MSPLKKPSSIPLEDDLENPRARVERRIVERQQRDATAVGEAMDAVERVAQQLRGAREGAKSSDDALAIVRDAANRPPAERASIEKPIEAPLTLAQFEERIEAEGLADKLPELRKQLAALADYNEKTFGFSFKPSELTIPAGDVPRMLLGLREGVLVRPIVIDSPTAEDVERLKLDGDMTMLEYRASGLAKNGMKFYNQAERIAMWKQLREVHWTDLRNDDGEVDASRQHLAQVYSTLLKTPTIADRIGASPRLVLIGPDDEPSENRVLADGQGGQPRIESRTSEDRTAEGALEARCRFLSPEASLLAVGASRDGKTSRFTRNTWGWTSGVTPDGSVAYVNTDVGDVDLGWLGPSGRHDGRRVPASSE